jgi:hypothetical protein
VEAVSVNIFLRCALSLLLVSLATTASANMTLTGAGSVGGSAPVLGTCAESQAFFTRAATNIAAAPTTALPPVATWEATVDTLICAQVTAGTWAGKDFEYFMAAPSAALAQMNLVSSSFTLTPHGTNLVFDPNVGFTGDATAAYLDTGYSPSTGQMTTTSQSMGACIINKGTQNFGAIFFIVMGAANGTSTEQFITEFNSNQAGHSLFGLGGSVTLNTLGETNTQGGWTVNRLPSISSTTFQAFYNASLLGTSGSSTGTLVSVPNIALLAYDDTGTVNKWSSDTMGLAFAGAGETAAQISADHTIYSAALAGMLIQSGC